MSVMKSKEAKKSTARRRSAKGMLLSSVCLGVGLASVGIVARANDAAIGGTNCPACINSNGQISVPGGFSPVDINVDTSPIGSSAAPVSGVGVYAFSTEDMTVTATQDITTTDRTIWLDSNSVTAGEGPITVRSSGTLTSTAFTGVEILQPYADVLLDGEGTGAISGFGTGVAVFGWADGGAIEIRDFASISGGGTSIYVDSNDADVSIQGIGQVGDVSSTLDGVYVDALFGGNINIGGETAVGSVQGGDDGMELYTSGDGTTTVSVAGDVTGNDFGIYTRGERGDIDIAIDGGIVEGTLTSGIDAIAVSGSISATGSNGAALVGEDRGIRAETEGADITISGFDSISSAVTAVEVFSFGGDISITGNGLEGGITGTGVDGILASGEATGGDVLISGNGAILGGDDGIEAYAFGDGAMTIETENDVTGNDFGIYARSGDSNTQITVSDGTVSGVLTTGIDAFATGSGSTTIDIASGATSQGALFGVVAGSAAGAPAATVNNAGLIRDSEDTGGAETAGGDAYWSWTGSTVLNNTGNIVGAVHSDGTAFALNNLDGGNWYASTGDNVFDSASDSLNNAGNIYIREGVTSFSGLENFTNQSGGQTNLSYGTMATDTLNVLNISSEAGSIYAFDFDASATNGAGAGYDDASDGLGTADTIVVTGTATSEAGTSVNVNHLAGDATSLTGSVALIYTGVNMDAPDPGTAIASSSTYSFGLPQSFTSTAYYLVDDGNGGLYYQWAPNLTTATLGAYGGGDMSDTGGAEAGIASASASFSSIGGVGLSGGGLSVAVADRAAASARSTGNTDPACKSERASNMWNQSGGSNTSGSGHSGNSFNVSFGYEQDLGDTANLSCGQLVAGIFAGIGNSSLAWSGGSSDTSSNSLGAYLRYTNSDGFYASGLAAVVWSDADMSNTIFESTASQKSVGYAAQASAGYVTSIGKSGSLDWRADLSYGLADGGAFTDSAGIEVNDTQSTTLTGGLSVAYQHQFNDASQGFIRAGIRRAKADREVTAFGVKVGGAQNATVGTLAAGFSSKLSENSSLDMAIHGSFGDSSDTIGASVGLNISF